MRKSMLVCLLSAICLMLFSACVDTDRAQNTVRQTPEITAHGDNNTADVPLTLATNNEQELTLEPSVIITNEEQTEEIATTPDPVDSESTLSEVEEDETSTEPIVIAESSNTVSDKEKQEVLDDLSRELDDILKGIGDLEDMDDSDLSSDNIE